MVLMARLCASLADVKLPANCDWKIFENWSSLLPPMYFEQIRMYGKFALFLCHCLFDSAVM